MQDPIDPEDFPFPENEVYRAARYDNRESGIERRMADGGRLAVDREWESGR
jgi:hypothetical protein